MRTILVTGASRGIGLALVRALAAFPCRLILACRDPLAAEQVIASLGPSAAQLFALPLNLQDPASIHKAAS